MPAKSATDLAVYQKAYDLSANGHNPPAAFSRPLARKKLAAP